MSQIKKITVSNTEISIMLQAGENDFISLTDMAKGSGDSSRAADIIKNWIRNRSTIEFLGTWESLYNPNFKVVEFDHFKKEAGLPTFTMSVNNWVESTHAIGIKSRPGRNGGTFAHKDIAFEFGAAISPVFKLYLIKEYQRLKESESHPLVKQWDVRRLLSKTNYLLHTDAIKENIIPKLSISKTKEYIVYANEADMLNLALFGYTAKDWEDANPTLSKKLNMRDTASINQLIVLSNMESYNSEMIKNGVPRDIRFSVLHKMAKEQLKTLDKNNAEQQFRKLSSSEGNTLKE